MNRRTALGAVLAAPLLIAAGTADPPSAQMIIAMTPSVVRIVSAGCGADRLEHVGTGFIWPDAGDVVTDLHLLVGCTGPISVTFWVGAEKSAPLPATVSHVLIPRDLALLHVANPPPEAHPLTIETTPPRPDDVVKVYGYPRGIAAPEDKRLAVSVQTETFPQLAAGLDGEARDQLVQLRFPRLDTEVVHLDGALSPGHSGAPVINGAGQVVGVGSGGLQQGAAGISWAVRTEYLQELLTQAAALPTAPGPTGALYALLEAPPAREGPALPAEPDIPSVTCGELTLTRQGTQTLEQLVNTSPDRATITRIAGEQLHIDLHAHGAERYEIWSEPASGVAIVVPPGAHLVNAPAPSRNMPGLCRTENANQPHISNIVRALRLPGNTTAPEWQFKLSTEEWQHLQLMSRLAGTGLTDVPGQERSWRMNEVVNGAWVRRFLWGAAGKHDGAANEHEVVILRSDLAGRGAYVMVAALARTELAKMDQVGRDSWAQSVLAVYLSTFPPLARDSDRTSAERKSAESAANDDMTDDAPAEVPADFTALRNYPLLQCGFLSLLRLSSVTSLGQAMSDAGNPQPLASLVAQQAGLRPSALAASLFDVWGQTGAGLGLFVPRDMMFSPIPDVRMAGPHVVVGNGHICQATHPGEPALKFIFFSLGNHNLANSEATITEGLEAALGVPVTPGASSGGLRVYTATTQDGHALRAWLAAADRNNVVTVMALVERDPLPQTQPLPTTKHTVLLAQDLTALGLSLHPPEPTTP